MQKKWFVSLLALGVLGACTIDAGDDEAACTAGLPEAADDHGEVRRGGIVTLDVLANDTNPGCGDLRIVAIGDAAHGNVAIDDGRLVYMPSRSYIGTDSFSYTVANDDGEDTAEVHLDIYESLTLEGRIELHSGIELADFTQADVTLTYADEVTESNLNEEGEYTLSIRVYDVEDLTWGYLDVVLRHTEEGSTSSVRSELHSWLPPHADLLESAESAPDGDGGEVFVVRASAQPGLKVTAFSSAFYALSQPYTAIFDEPATDIAFTDALSRAALAIDAQVLQDIALLNASLVDGVLGLNDIRVPNAATDFVGLVNDKARLATVLQQVQELEAKPQFSANVFAGIEAQQLYGRHLEIGAQSAQWLRAYHYTWQFGANELARIEAAKVPELATYVTDNEQIYFSNLLDSARLLYADSESMWFSAVDREGDSLTFRLMKDSAFKLSGEPFDLSRDWVMPTTAGRAMEKVYRFHSDGTFSTSHATRTDERALQNGTWSLNDGGTSLLLSQDGNNVRMQRLRTSGGLPQVLVEDMQNHAIRIGPALPVNVESGVVSELIGRRLLSLFEVRGPEHWREGELVGTPEVDVTFLNQTQGTMTQRTYSFAFDWQVVSHQGIAQVIEMRGESNLDMEQRIFWLPLDAGEGRVTVLEWVQTYSDSQPTQLSTTPRINIYCQRDACSL